MEILKDSNRLNLFVSLFLFPCNSKYGVREVVKMIVGNAFNATILFDQPCITLNQKAFRREQTSGDWGFQ